MLTYNPPREPSQPCSSEELACGGGYFPEDGLRDAVNVALVLRKPLLLTGDPGTGKTTLAANLAYTLGLPPPLCFETKSDSQSADLFYTYDAMRRFHARESGVSTDLRDYFHFNALGEAILRTREPASVADLLSDELKHTEKRQSVVLIDEIDKAPRDFPNDLLNEIEHLFFRIPEFGNKRISVDETLRPIIVITSNSEKDLPDPFLRRCVYYHIGRPDLRRMRAILISRLGERVAGLDAFVDDLCGLFSYLATDVDLKRAPSTSELIDWTIALRRAAPECPNPLHAGDDIPGRTLSALIKDQDDIDTVREIITQQAWTTPR